MSKSNSPNCLTIGSAATRRKMENAKPRGTSGSSFSCSLILPWRGRVRIKRLLAMSHVGTMEPTQTDEGVPEEIVSTTLKQAIWAYNPSRFRYQRGNPG